MKKFIISCIIILILFIIPFGCFYTYGGLQENKYSETYYGEMKYKINLLKEKSDLKRIIFIGGSSLAFGLRCDELEKATGYHVINFGLYGQFGSKAMLELAKNKVKKDDIIIFAPEIETSNYSTYINYESLWKALENCKEEIFSLDYQDCIKMNEYYYPFVLSKNKIGTILLESPYTKDSFNEFGDIDSAKVNQNILMKHYDENQIIVPNSEIITDDYLSYLNQYALKMKKKNVSMFFAFSPSNILGIDETKEEELNQKLNQKLTFPVLGKVQDYVYNQDYFYDTNYHLNRTGSFLHSKNLLDHLRQYFTFQTNYDILVGPRPEPLYQEISQSEINNHLLLSKVTMDGKDNYLVSGLDLKSLGSLTSLSIPGSIGGIPVIGILNQAFKDATNLEEITLPKTIKEISGTPFINCPSLKRINITSSYPPSVPVTNLFDGASKELQIYVYKEYYDSYCASGYTWTHYLSYLNMM